MYNAQSYRYAFANTEEHEQRSQSPISSKKMWDVGPETKGEKG